MCNHHCPLCHAAKPDLFCQDTWRSFYRCTDCQLVFVPASFHLSPEQEKAEYDLHQNSPDDINYRNFLNRLFEPMEQRLPKNSYGLDFGSGPGPTLSVMFNEAGYEMEIYDPFYCDNPKTIQLPKPGCSDFAPYDFITASEVVEHLRKPAEELNRLWSRLKPNGILGIMTKQVIDQSRFAKWHYKNDPTHICFFSQKTFSWLADQWDCQLELIGKDVVLFTKHTP